MKKIILSAAMLLATVAISTAQTNEKNDKGGKFRRNSSTTDSLKRTPEQIAQAQADRMKADFKLNDKQSKEVYTLALERAKNRQEQMKSRMAQFKEQTSKNKKAMSSMREKMKAQRNAETQAYESQLQKIMDQEQYSQYLQKKEAKMKQAQEKMTERKNRIKS